MNEFMTQVALILGKALAAILVIIVPILIKKLHEAVDGWIEALKIRAKATEHARVKERLSDFLEIVDVAVNGAFTVAEKVKVETVDGKPKITNLDALAAELKGSVLKQATNSTGELMQKLGVDIEEVIKAKVQARLGRAL